MKVTDLERVCLRRAAPERFLIGTACEKEITMHRVRWAKSEVEQTIKRLPTPLWLLICAMLARFVRKRKSVTRWGYEPPHSHEWNDHPWSLLVIQWLLLLRDIYIIQIQRQIFSEHNFTQLWGPLIFCDRRLLFQRWEKLPINKFGSPIRETNSSLYYSFSRTVS